MSDRSIRPPSAPPVHSPEIFSRDLVSRGLLSREPLFSLVISTIGPAEDLSACLSSILAQTLPAFEVIVVDQNATDHVRAITEAFAWSGKVHYTRSEVGLSKGRNAGLALARGTYVGFPDDDCTYPPKLLQEVRERFHRQGDASGICVRCIDHRGYDSAGRSDRRGGLITKGNVWSRAVSVGIFLKRAAVTQTGGFDERIGLGSNTPYLSGEETDLLLTLVQAGHRIYYDPLLHVFHPPNPPVITAKHITRSYAYGMGKGLLLRRYAYKNHHVAIHVARPVLGAFIAAIRGNLALARLRIRRAQGRYDGWKPVDCRLGLERRRFLNVNDSARSTPGSSMQLTVGIATSGRNTTLRQALYYLSAQSRPPDEVIVCSPEDTEPGFTEGCPFKIRHIRSEIGSSRQRNAIIREARDCDVLLFFDDDFFPCREYVAEIVRIFASQDDVVVATGTVVADGIKGPGISFDEAERIIRREDEANHPPMVHPVRQGYGCNMALRYEPLVAHNLSFDENLPRYGWYEDVDLMRRLGAHGQAVRSVAARGVHLGTKTGRVSGKFLGYAQIANPFYLHRKGTYGVNEAILSVCRNVAANAGRSFYPESYIDRRGRLLGNLIGLRDLVMLKLHPMNALRIDAIVPK